MKSKQEAEGGHMLYSSRHKRGNSFSSYWTLLPGAAVLGALLISSAAIAQAPPPAAILPPTAEGDWIRVDHAGSGSLDGLLSTYKPAQLTPAAKKTADSLPNRPAQTGPGNDLAHPLAAGQAAVVNATPCVYNGGQLPIEYDSEGFHMVLGKRAAVFTAERGGSRSVYLDGRPLPTAQLRVPTPSGYSVGHVEPDGTLVVETTDMTQGRVAIGGFRTPDTKVTQHYVPSADGQHLTLTLTWTDPAIYLSPHTYAYDFDRMPADSYVRDEFCDASNPLYGQSVVPPEQR